MNVAEKVKARVRRHLRVRKKVFGTPDQPRFCVFRSERRIYGQIIDDTKGHTLVSAAGDEPEMKAKKFGSKQEAAKEIGKLLATRAKEAGVTRVVFDRAGYIYHGRIKAIADGAREGGLEF